VEVIELKFRLKKGKGSVSGYTDATGVTHIPGDIVDLPPSFDGEAWLERVYPEVVVAAAPGKFEPIAAALDVPLEAASKRHARPRKKSGF